MDLKQEILNLFYDDKLKQKDIAQKLQVSKYIVSRTVSKDERYLEEKARRKEETKIKNRKDTIEYIKTKRAHIDIDYLHLKRQHLQASGELSERKNVISNKAFRDWNPSIYKYDSKTQSYKLKDGILTGSDVPKKISWK